MSKFRVRITGVSPAAAAMLGGLAAGLLCQAVAAAPAQKKTGTGNQGATAHRGVVSAAVAGGRYRQAGPGD